MTIAGIAIAQWKYPDKINYIYQNDSAIIEELSDINIQNCITVYVSHNYNNHSVYDCINLLPESVKIYPVNGSHHQIETEDCPNKLLIWTLIRQDIQPYVFDLIKDGYVIEKVGSTHCSDVYVAERSE